MPQRTFALCADDFGLRPEISAAIVDLVARKRLSSVSCITNAAGFAQDANLLRPHLHAIEVGLHFNLTEGTACCAPLAKHWPSLPSVARLILRSHSGRLPIAAIAAELTAQLQLFRAAFGQDPDFIDGHQHIHDLPGIRPLVVAYVKSHADTMWLRNTGHIDGKAYRFKRTVIEMTGGRALQKNIRANKLKSNAVLLGVYDFARTDYRGLMQAWLQRLPNNSGLIFCHPGKLATAAGANHMAACRHREWQYLASDAFAEDLEQAQASMRPLGR